MANNGCNVVPNSFGSKSLWTYMEFQSHQMWPTARQANGPLAVDDQCGSTQKRIAVWSTHVMLNKLVVMDVRSLPFTDRLLYCIICCSYDFTVTLVIGYIRIISPLYAGGKTHGATVISKYKHVLTVHSATGRITKVLFFCGWKTWRNLLKISSDNHQTWLENHSMDSLLRFFRPKKPPVRGFAMLDYQRLWRTHHRTAILLAIDTQCEAAYWLRKKTTSSKVYHPWVPCWTYYPRLWYLTTPFRSRIHLRR